MSEQATIWTVWSDYGREMSLRSATGTLTTATFIFDRDQDTAPWRYVRRIRRDRVHFSPKDALDAALKSYVSQIEQAEQSIGRARFALAWITDEQSKLVEP